MSVGNSPKPKDGLGMVKKLRATQERPRSLLPPGLLNMPISESWFGLSPMKQTPKQSGNTR